MKFARTYSAPGEPYAGVTFEPRTSKIVNPNGSMIFEAKDIQIPAEWSQVATDIIAQKYFRKAGVPSVLKGIEEPDIPQWLWRSEPADDATFGPETDARQVFHRLTGTWTYWGYKHGYFDTESDARAYYDEMCAMLARQIGAPNSPQWFNTTYCTGRTESRARPPRPPLRRPQNRRPHRRNQRLRASSSACLPAIPSSRHDTRPVLFPLATSSRRISSASRFMMNQGSRE